MGGFGVEMGLGIFRFLGLCAKLMLRNGWVWGRGSVGDLHMVDPTQWVGLG